MSAEKSQLELLASKIELLQAVRISMDLTRNALTRKRLVASDVESAISYARETSEKLGKLRLALLGIEPD